MTLECGGCDTALDPEITRLEASTKILRPSKAPSPLRCAGALQIRTAFFAACFLLLTLFSAQGQQPFYTDNTDVTDKKKFNLQISNEYDILQRAAYPSLRQDTTVFELDYGLGNGVEIGVDGPLIAISNSRVTTPRTPFGFGDLDFHMKYNFLKEREGKNRLPRRQLSG